MSLFVDTSVWYAAADSDDVDNDVAMRVLSLERSLLTTDHVLVETWRLLRHRVGRGAAETFLAKILDGLADVEDVVYPDIQSALQIGVEYPDQDFSLVDRTSFVVMQRLGVRRVATFDRHFSVYRFGLGRKQAFTVVK
ncbi:MAG: PIN domain-containing protein [Bryobacterales bacterium]|nr:PIN domain-containing protein [Acidobacteriota bacterium]MCB9385816.1 PIN domain-containing protein [Bryobacterales bacterium]